MELMQLTELLATCITVIVFDFKGDFVDVPQRLGKDRWRHFSATDGLRLPLGPPLLCQGQYNWIAQYTKIFAAHCDLKYSEAALASAIRIALSILSSIFIGIPVWPSLLLIEEILQYVPIFMLARKEDYLRSLQHRLEYLRRISGSLFDNETGFDFYEHLVKPRLCAVIDCTLLDPLRARILVNLMSLQILFPRIEYHMVSSRVNTFIICDESDPILSFEGSKGYEEGYSQIGKVQKQGREFGITNCSGLCFLGICDPSISANYTYHIVLNQTDPASIHAAANTMLIPDGEQLIASAKQGVALFKEAMGPIPYAMLAKMDYVEPAHTQRPDSFDTHPYTPGRGINDIPGFRERLDQFVAEYKASTFRHKQITQTKPLLNPNERIFIDTLSLHESEPLHKIFDRMDKRLSPATEQTILKKLKKLELIDLELIRSSKSLLRFGTITDKGWEFLGKQSLFKKTQGGPTHRCLCFLKQRYDLKHGGSSSECDVLIPGANGGRTDVLTRKNDGLHATEVIVHCETNIAKHVRDCLVISTQILSLTFIVCLKSDEQKVRDEILSEADLVFIMNKIHFMTMDQLLKEVL